MSRRKTRFLAMLLSLALAFSVGGVIAFAVDDAGDDTPETPAASLAIEPEVEGTGSIDEDTPETQTNGEGEPAVISDDENTPVLLADDEPQTYEVNTDDEFLAAIGNAKEGDTIVLTSDILVTETSGEWHYKIDKSITVDLGGKYITVESAPSASRLFNVGNADNDTGADIDVTIKNGTIDGKNTAVCYAIMAYGIDSLTLEDIDVTNFVGTSSNGDTYAAVYFYGDELNATGCSFSSNTGRKGLYCFGGDITIDGCTISNNTVVRTPVTYGVGMEINYADKVLIENSTISDNQADEDHPDVGGGGIVIYASSDVTLYKNTITNNAAGTDVYSMGGGGVFLWDCYGDLLIDNNTISNNTAGEFGGGVYILNSGDTYVLDTILIRDNTITNNTVLPTDRANTSGTYYAYGGGVMIEDHSTHHDGTCIFSGNDISYNTALNNKNSLYGRGGGISLYGDDSGREFWIYSGTFIGNQADWGGAIDFTYKESSALHLYNALITDNTAVRGGGIWLCPTSETAMYDTFGGAIYGNHATGTITSTWSDGNTYTYPSTGDDIRYEGVDSDIYPEIRSGYDDDVSLANSKVTVMERALGDELMDWYEDDASTYYDYDSGTVTSSESKRYSDGGELVDVLTDYTNRSESFGLHGELDDHGVELANKEAEVIISGNSATQYGGGIASNSTVYFGIDEYTELSIIKYWQDENGDDLDESTLPEKINVTLVRVDEGGNKEDLETVTLNAGNEWSWTFKDLEYEYMIDNEGVAEYYSYTYEVKEVKDGYSEGYTPRYKIVYDSGLSGGMDYIILAITNTPTAETPEPDTPEEPTTPSTTQITGQKIWDDNDNEAGIRPDTITIRLYADGELIRSRTVRASDSWRFSFTDLEKYGSDGHEIVYTIEEVQIPGYSAEYDGYDITNTYIDGESELIEIPVTKVWDDANDIDGIRPDSITVELYLNGEPTNMTLILDESNGWSGTFTDLAEETDGVKNVWTVSEVAVEGYESSVTGNSEDGFVITNTHTPDEIEVPEEPDVPVEPEIPDEPQEPETPDEPSEPETPEEPAEPETPENPENPDEQVTPETPSEPENSDSQSGLPQTGARWNLVVCIVMLAFGGTMLVVAGRGMMSTVRRKRR